jgi:methyl-accepting chemotaxis protein
LFGFATGERLSYPVKKILQRANELGDGDLKARVYLDDKDEFGELAKAFNKIADALQESKAQTERTEKTVDIKVKAKTESFEETINALEQKVRNRTLELERIMEESKGLQELLSKKELEIIELKKEMEIRSGKNRAKKTEPEKTDPEKVEKEENI